MYNPPHPGEFITEVYLDPNGISGRTLADKLNVAASTLSRILIPFPVRPFLCRLALPYYLYCLRLVFSA
jgi:hypothetical protein